MKAMETKHYAVDLHCHTTRSDGADTPRELIDHAAARGLKVIAITDHDICPPEEIMDGSESVKLTEYAWERGVHVIPGIEVSCDTRVEDVHIVCLGCDWTKEYFRDLEQMVALSKLDAYRALVRELQRAGYDLTWEEVLENGGSPVTEERVQKKMIFETLSRKGYFSSWSDAKLMVKSDSRFSIPRVKPDPLAVIGAAHDTGGVAILAHPYLITPNGEAEDLDAFRTAYIERLMAAGLDGIEVRYPYEKTSYAGTLSSGEIEQRVRKHYGTRLDILSGGSDYHADGKKGVKHPRELGECGLTWAEFCGNSSLSALLNKA